VDKSADFSTVSTDWGPPECGQRDLRGWSHVRARLLGLVFEWRGGTLRRRGAAWTTLPPMARTSAARSLERFFTRGGLRISGSGPGIRRTRRSCRRLPRRNRTPPVTRRARQAAVAVRAVDTARDDGLRQGMYEHRFSGSRRYPPGSASDAGLRGAQKSIAGTWAPNAPGGGQESVAGGESLGQPQWAVTRLDVPSPHGSQPRAHPRAIRQPPSS
jgi:hypothetical protein